MRGTGRGAIAVLLSLTIAVAGTVALSRWTATSAIAACDYGWPYAVALPLAKAALVGRVLAVRHDGPGSDWVTAVRVERVTGLVRGSQVGPTSERDPSRPDRRRSSHGDRPADRS